MLLPSIREALLGKSSILSEESLNSFNTDSELEMARSEVPKLFHTRNCVWQALILLFRTTPTLAFKKCMLPTECVFMFNIRHNLGVGLE